jgi:TPR repeat protein
MADFNRGLACVTDAAAFASLLHAAEAGCHRAQMRVGLAYQTGRGAGLDFERAAWWYGEAAAAGDDYAIANLGLMSLLGEVPADDLDAYAWIESAVGLGHSKLRPALEILRRRINGEPVDPRDGDGMLASTMPEVPPARPCTRTICDPCRCTAA